MALTRRFVGTLGALPALALLACAVAAAIVAGGSGSTAAPAAEERTVPLDRLIAGWPTSYTVTATKSEPQYVEHITTTRDGDRFALEIVIQAQGSSAGGSSLAEVAVSTEGIVSWTTGCSEPDCSDDNSVRGFLAAAALLSADREDRLPATAVLRQLGDHEVACVSDSELFPASAATALARLDPCFSVETGAVLGHYSIVNAAFVGPTMSAGSIAETVVPSPALFTSPPS